MLFNQLINGIRANIGQWTRPVSANREILTRCKFCSDSTDPRHGHFYIKTVENAPIVFHCVKCQTSGLLTPTVAVDWGITNPEVLGLLEVYNKNVLSMAENKKYMVGNNTKYRLRTNYITDSPTTRKKIDYINERIGTRISYNDCRQMKIVPNIIDLLSENKVRDLTLSHRTIEELNRHYVGFLSYDGAFINLRQVTTPSLDFLKDRRWINYNIFGKYDNCQRFYTMPNDQIDPTRPVTINVAEGVFDILSIRFNIYEHETDNAIFSTEAGNSYRSTVKCFSSDLGIIGPSVRFFYDNDVKESKMIEVYNHFDIFCEDIKLISNGYPGEKDFGVKSNRIVMRELDIEKYGME